MKKTLLTAAAFGGLVAWGQPAPAPAAPPAPPASPRAMALEDTIRANVNMKFNWAGRGRDEDLYRRASRLVDDRKYEQALETYKQLVDAKGTRVEGALYWKAYVLAKLGKRDEALAALEDLKKGYAMSRWLNDARALELEIKQNAGRGTSPEAEGDEELKLLAINGLLSTDPERAIPLLEKQLNNPKNSPKLKERSLFVLAQSKSAKAREIVSNYAKGASNPDLQLMAVQYLGSFGGKENREKLMEIYRGGGDLALKRAVLRGLMISHDQESLMQIARSEQNPELQREVVRYAGNAGGDVSTLWSASASKEMKEAILEGLMSSNNVLKLAEIAKSDPDVQIRREAVQFLANAGRERTGTMLVGMYSSETDKKIRVAILRGLMHQGNAKALVELAKKEQDPELKREAVQRLSSMKSPEATEYLVELLNK